MGSFAGGAGVCASATVATIVNAKTGDELFHACPPFFSWIASARLAVSGLPVLVRPRGTSPAFDGLGARFYGNVPCVGSGNLRLLCINCVQQSEECDETSCDPGLHPRHDRRAASGACAEAGGIQRHGVRSAAYARLRLRGPAGADSGTDHHDPVQDIEPSASPPPSRPYVVVTTAGRRRGWLAAL